MAFSSGFQSRAILGSFAIAGYVAKVDVGGSVALGDVTVLTSTAETFIPLLKSGGQFNLTGYLDTDGSATGQNQAISAKLQSSTDTPISYAPAGFARGNVTMNTVAQMAQYKVSTDVKAPVGWTLSAMADGALDNGISLADLAQVSATTTSTAVDNAAGTTNGGAGYLHVTQYAGLTNVVFKVQHSTDNSSWSDLATFTTITAIGSQQVVVAAATTVNRYVRALATATGTGTVTYQMSFARR